MNTYHAQRKLGRPNYAGRVNEIVEHYRFSSILTEPDLLSGESARFQQWTQHATSMFPCDKKQRTVFIVVDEWRGHIENADEFLKEINIFMSPWLVTRVGEFIKETPDCKLIETGGRK